MNRGIRKMAVLGAVRLAGDILAKFDESKVKRDEDGKFTFKDGPVKTAAKYAAAFYGANVGLGVVGLPVFRAWQRTSGVTTSGKFSAKDLKPPDDHEIGGVFHPKRGYTKQRQGQFTSVISIPGKGKEVSFHTHPDLPGGGAKIDPPSPPDIGGMLTDSRKNIVKDYAGRVYSFAPGRTPIGPGIADQAISKLIRRKGYGAAHHSILMGARDAGIIRYGASRVGGKSIPVDPKLRALSARYIRTVARQTALAGAVQRVGAAILRSVPILAKFDESKVERDEDGRFTFKDGAVAGGGVGAAGAAVVAGREGLKMKVAADRGAFLRQTRDFYGRYPDRGGKPVFRGAPVVDPTPVPRKHQAVYVAGQRRVAGTYARAKDGGVSTYMANSGKPGVVSAYILSRKANVVDALEHPLARKYGEELLAASVARGKSSAGGAAPPKTPFEPALQEIRRLGNPGYAGQEGVDYINTKIKRLGQWKPTARMVQALRSQGIHGTTVVERGGSTAGREYALYAAKKHLRFLGEAPKVPKISTLARVARRILRVR